MKLVLIRHAESVANREKLVTGDDDTELTDQGIQEALNLKSDILRYRVCFNKILFYSSPANRAIKTALLAGISSKELNIDNRINETYAGLVGNLNIKIFNQIMPDFFGEFDLRRKYPDGESHSEMVERSLSFLKYVSNSDALCSIVFTHGGPINAILHEVNQVDLASFPNFKIANCQIIEISL